jgi:hypothetical protein
MMKQWSRREYSRRDLERAGEPLGECVTLPKLGGGYICGGGGKGDAPAAPDYRGAAQEQAASSKEVTNIQNWANRPTQVTPWGTIDWKAEATTDPATGQAVTKWTQNYNTSPETKEALAAQMQMQTDRSKLAGSFMDRVEQEYANPFNWGGLPDRGGNVQGSQFQSLQGNAPQLQTELQNQANGAERQRIEQALFERMAPQHERQQSALDAKLANQGITAGSEAYKRATQALGDQQSRERFNALEMGGQEMARLQQQQLANAQFGNTALQNQQSLDQNRAGFNNQVAQNQFAQGMQQSQYQNTLRQQAIAEEAQRRGMSLNEMNALLTGQQVGMQQMPSFNAAQRSEPVQYMQAAQNQYQANLDASNLANANQNSTMNGLFQLGSTAAMGAMMFSDSRLKKIVRKLGEKNGFGWYLFKYLGSTALYEGAIAQEVQKVKPEAVTQHANGFLMVNYAALEA